ncbi:GNAT family N-acetyltransferase [Rhizobium sullae]|nr:GNAT family N-acetyltransferase [Rhizobium sullae]UWU15493.1 GNAT family N-acetyltransferase [Rhizobium sullae]
MTDAIDLEFSPDFHLYPLHDEGGAGARTRQFCLDVIKEFYGFDYRPDWHGDLDSLLMPPAGNHFSSLHRGGFWIVENRRGDIIATTGIRHLGWKPNCAALFSDLYGDGTGIASLWRQYVRKDMRGRGLGKKLAALGEKEALRRGYERMYLHASSNASATVGFWKSRGYVAIADDDETIHFDKLLTHHLPQVATA